MNSWRDLLAQLPGIDVITVIIDLAIVYFLIYRMLLLIKGTRAAQMVMGMLIVFGLFVISKDEFLNLSTLNWILDKFVTYIIVILIILFQPDIRRALSEMGKNPLVFGYGKDKRSTIYDEIVAAAVRMAKEKIGAIIVIEREADLKPFTEGAAEIDAKVLSDTLFAIFVPTSSNPLHDGAVIIRQGRISHAGCFLPLADNPNVDKTLGSRHRAAIGLTEATDAVAVVVSEESGKISLAVGGHLERGLDEKTLRARLKELFGPRRRDTSQHGERPQNA